MKFDAPLMWKEAAESLVIRQEAMREAGFDISGQAIEGHATPMPLKPLERTTVKDWLKVDNLRNTVAAQDSLIRELVERQDRQAKWIVFLLVSWVFSGFFLALAVVMVR